jgi:hypothetical protein
LNRKKLNVNFKSFNSQRSFHDFNFKDNKQGDNEVLQG